jgi:hypothetical protein
MNLGSSSRGIKILRDALRALWGVHPIYTDPGDCAIFMLDWRLAGWKKGMPDKPAESGMTA